MAQGATATGALLGRFMAANDELAAMVAGCDDGQWRRITAEEGWPVGTTAHHAAIVQEAFVRIATRLAAGETFSPSADMASIDAENARHAVEYAEVDRAAVLTPLRESAARIAGLLGRLDDAALGRVAGVFGGNELRVAQVIEYVIIGHLAYHLGSIRETVTA